MQVSLSDLKDIATIIQSVATVSAIIIGGVWTYWLFIRKRQKYPRAKIEHRISHRPTNGKILLSIDVIISNSSDVLLLLESGKVLVSQVLPPQAELLSILNGSPGTEVTDWRALVPLRNPTWKKGELELEPGESQQLPYHFVIDASIQTVLVYTYFRNIKKRGRVLGWELTTIYDLQPSW